MMTTMMMIMMTTMMIMTMMIMMMMMTWWRGVLFMAIWCDELANDVYNVEKSFEIFFLIKSTYFQVTGPQPPLPTAPQLIALKL